MLSSTFETEKNRKAFLYTAIICIGLLLLFILISWKTIPPSVPVIQDLMEINLGNDEEGFGEEQPLIKGNRTPAKEAVIAPSKQAAAASAPEDRVTPDDNADADAAPVVKPSNKIPKVKLETVATPVVAPPKPQKPKLVYDGPSKGPAGNNPTQDNGYRYQGNKPGGKNDNGSPTGNADSYGNTPGGKTGGARVTRGNRKIVRFYNFTGELGKATIYAKIKVSAAGKGTFVGFDKGSTSQSSQYANDIRQRLSKMEFDRADEESEVTVQFNYNIN